MQSLGEFRKLVQEARGAMERHLRYSLAVGQDRATVADLFRVASLTLREAILDRMYETERRFSEVDAKRVYYLSMEFLMGRSLENNLQNLGLLPVFREALRELGGDLEKVCAAEPDAALGNGGLGRLAACFVDSLASLGYPGFGYGINYEFGLFRQEIHQGQQREHPDNWLEFGTPWEIERPGEACLIPCYGRIEHGGDQTGNYNPLWLDWKVIVGVPHDFPVVGWQGETVTWLRLYSARSSSEFDMKIFNAGDYLRAVEQKVSSENLSKVLYPSDSVEAGRELRLLQEYFLVACTLRDIVKNFTAKHSDFNEFPKKVAIQLNDTHPALAVVELMRVLVDEQQLQWEDAWQITVATCGYTNHTLMPEALEKWPVSLLEKVIPRHLQLIYEINRRFLQQVASRWPGDGGKLSRMSLFEEGDLKCARMAHLAIVGSHSVNGVARLHSDLVKESLVPDFAELWPLKFNNKTNGVTQRRWLWTANRGLASLLTEAVGDHWVADLDSLRGLEPLATDPGFQHEFERVKLRNKQRLSQHIWDSTRIRVDPASLFDIQVKRIHEYKRQLLNVLNIVSVYFRMVEDGVEPVVPRTWIFSGKAAPGYQAAKDIIRLIHSVAEVVNGDKRVKNLMKVVFIPDYRVSLAELIIPAGEVSEQISTAGTEASGTSNMKFAMNGALTLGTLDGANVEIRDAVGEENIFIFGLRAHEVMELKATACDHPSRVYHSNASCHRVVDRLTQGYFNRHDPGLYGWLRRRLVFDNDPYFHILDLGHYEKAHLQVAQAYLDRPAWLEKAILNVARTGYFSSDRTIREYSEDIWEVKPVLERQVVNGKAVGTAPEAALPHDQEGARAVG